MLISGCAELAGTTAGSAFGKSSRGTESATPAGLTLAFVEYQGFTTIPQGSGVPLRKARASGSARMYCQTARAASDRPWGTRTSAIAGLVRMLYFHSGSL